MMAPDLACNVTGALPSARVALVEHPQVHITVHAKKRGTVEVRVMSQLPNGNWHRIGTLCMARTIWERDWRELLTSGAAQHEIDLTITEAAA